MKPFNKSEQAKEDARRAEQARKVRESQPPQPPQPAPVYDAPVPGQSREDAKAIERDQAKQDRAGQLKAEREKTENPPADPNAGGQADHDRAAERARLASEKVVKDEKDAASQSPSHPDYDSRR